MSLDAFGNITDDSMMKKQVLLNQCHLLVIKRCIYLVNNSQNLCVSDLTFQMHHTDGMLDRALLLRSLLL